jgi:DNA-binding MarR family transcriptional regulator
MVKPVQVLFKEKPLRILLTLYETSPLNLKELSRKIKTPESYAVKLVERLESFGLIKTEKVGKERLIDITEKGTIIVSKIKEILLFL